VSDQKREAGDGLDVADALAAAAAWLQRMDAPAHAAVVVTVAPEAEIGILLPGVEAVQVRPTTDDQIEVCEAVAPIVLRALEQLADPIRQSVRTVIDSGRGKLQMLLDPAGAEIVLRLVNGQSAVRVAATRLRTDSSGKPG
jgi:electron transfer flavoprotein alpha/beta subunit